eukprot:2597122-Prymnesium_polylepis.1
MHTDKVPARRATTAPGSPSASTRTHNTNPHVKPPHPLSRLERENSNADSNEPRPTLGASAAAQS